MPVATLPPSVRQFMGEEVAADFSGWLDVTLVERTVHRDEFRVEIADLRRTMDERFDGMNARFDQMNEQVNARFDHMNEQMNQRFDRMYEQMDARFDQMNMRFDRVNEQMDARFDRMNERFDQMYGGIMVMTRWTVGTLALLGTIMTILVAISQFT